MTRAAWRLLACCALLLAPAPASCAVELKVLATDPAPEALLARSQPFFVCFEVKNEAPVAVAVSGLRKGEVVADNGGASVPTALPAGGGTGIARFFYWGEQPTRIDEVRLNIYDSRTHAKLGEYAFPVALTWLTDDQPPREPPAGMRDCRQRAVMPGAANSTQPGIWLMLAAGLALLAVTVLWLRRRNRAAPDDDATRR